MKVGKKSAILISTLVIFSIICIGLIFLIENNYILSTGPSKKTLVKKVESVFNSKGENIDNVIVDEISTFNETDTLKPYTSSNKKRFWFGGKVGKIQVSGDMVYKKTWDKWELCSFGNLKDDQFEGIPNVYLEEQSLVGEHALGVTIKNLDDIKLTSGYANFNTGKAEYWFTYKDDKGSLREEVSFKNVNNTWKFSNIGFIENENTLKFYNEM